VQVGQLGGDVEFAVIVLQFDDSAVRLLEGLENRNRNQVKKNQGSDAVTSFTVSSTNHSSLVILLV